MVTTSAGFKLKREEYPDQFPDRTVFDPGTCTEGYYLSKRSRFSHSRRSRRNMIPEAIVAAETDLSRTALLCVGQNQTVFEETLAAFI